MAMTALAPVIPIAPAPPSGRRLRLVPPPTGPAATHEVRVLIAAGPALLRAGYRALLESAAGISIAGEAATADDAVRLAHWSDADVGLL
jgi:DNA-binding NarL/FixJ family response regulator